jgi:transposase-like protein
MNCAEFEFLGTPPESGKTIAFFSGDPNSFGRTVTKMREFVFDLVYEGCEDPLAEVFPDEQSLTSKAIGGCIEINEFWRIERFREFHRRADNLNPVPFERLFELESVTREPCDGSVHVKLLETGSEQCNVYCHVKDVHECDSVATLAVEYLGTDVLFEVERADRREQWTVVTDSDDGIGLMYDALQASLRPEIGFRFGHIGPASDRQRALFSQQLLPPEQRQALVTAVQKGYYETPRQVTIEAMAEELDCPSSTLSYRLRQAESKLAKTFAAENESSQLEEPPRMVDSTQEK